MAQTYCTGQGQGLGSDGFLYYTMHCTHYTGTGTIVTVRNSSCGKAMVSQVCVKNLVGGGGVGVHPGPLRQTTPGRHTHTPWADTHPTPHQDGHCSGRYASYWNAFFFSIVLILVPVQVPAPCPVCISHEAYFPIPDRI